MIEETRMQEAYEFAPKVRVNDLAPGGTSIPIGGIESLEHRPMLATQEMGEQLRSINPLQPDFDAEAHVGAYLYLAGENLSRGVTGGIIDPDGGLGSRGFSRFAGLL